MSTETPTQPQDLLARAKELAIYSPSWGVVTASLKILPELIAEIERLRSRPAPAGWRKVSEGLPPQTSPVYFVAYGNVLHGMFGDVLFHCEYGLFPSSEVTHWQPWTLPELPSELSQGGDAHEPHGTATRQQGLPRAVETPAGGDVTTPSRAEPPAADLIESLLADKEKLAKENAELTREKLERGGIITQSVVEMAKELAEARQAIAALELARITESTDANGRLGNAERELARAVRNHERMMRELLQAKDAEIQAAIARREGRHE
jgi:hypothetical protein